MLRFVIETMDKEIEQYNLGHNLVEEVIKILRERVLERRGFKEKDKNENERLSKIENEFSMIKETLDEIKDLLRKQ